MPPLLPPPPRRASEGCSCWRPLPPPLLLLLLSLGWLPPAVSSGLFSSLMFFGYTSALLEFPSGLSCSALVEQNQSPVPLTAQVNLRTRGIGAGGRRTKDTLRFSREARPARH